jgi:hypothetical protein
MELGREAEAVAYVGEKDGNHGRDRAPWCYRACVAYGLELYISTSVHTHVFFAALSLDDEFGGCYHVRSDWLPVSSKFVRTTEESGFRLVQGETSQISYSPL